MGLLLAGRASAQTPLPVTALVYDHPGRLVAVQGERRLNLICMGQDSPTVILEAGLGDSSLTWASVQKDIATHTTVCAYDRAGYGFSDPAERVSNAANAVDDLHRLLDASGVKRPIVLVAHSLGGLYATLFTARHRDEVAGLVLIDPSFASQNREIFLLSTPRQRAASDARLHGFISSGERCLALAKAGRLQDTGQSFGCLPTVPEPALNAISRRAYTRAQTQAANLSEILSISSFENDKISDDSRAIDGVNPDFGALPMIVLSRGNPAPPPLFFDEATQAKVDAAWKRGHDRLAAYSTLGQSWIVPKSDHYIQRDQPAAVIAAVREVVDTVRAKGSDPKTAH